MPVLDGVAPLLPADAELLFGFPPCLYPAAGARLPVHGDPDALPVLGGRSTLCLASGTMATSAARAGRSYDQERRQDDPPAVHRGPLELPAKSKLPGRPRTRTGPAVRTGAPCAQGRKDNPLCGVRRGPRHVRPGRNSALLFLFGRYKHLNDRPSHLEIAPCVPSRGLVPFVCFWHSTEGLGGGYRSAGGPRSALRAGHTALRSRQTGCN